MRKSQLVNALWFLVLIAAGLVLGARELGAEAARCALTSDGSRSTCVITGATDDANLTPIMLRVNPATFDLLVEAVFASGQTVTANQGTPNTIGNAWPFRLTDTSRNAVLAVAAPGQTDAGLVVRPITFETATYRACANVAPDAAGATDILTLYGSGSTITRLRRLEVEMHSTATASLDLYVIKRSTANTLGTSAAMTRVPLDSSNAAATATATSYTANPTLGTAVGDILITQVRSHAATGAFATDRIIWPLNPADAQNVTLRSTAEGFNVNLNASNVAIAGLRVDLCIEWTESTN